MLFVADDCLFFATVIKVAFTLSCRWPWAANIQFPTQLRKQKQSGVLLVSGVLCVAVCRVLPAVCCWLCGCVLFVVATCLSSVVRCLLRVVCCLLCAVWCLMFSLLNG